MSIRILLDNQPEFYTNLDSISGRVVVSVNRPEQIGSIVVKLEGESLTCIQVSYDQPNPLEQNQKPLALNAPGSIVSENHKILYKIQQVFPDEYYASSSSHYGAFPLQPGEHEFPFKFKVPINNACSDQLAMSRIGGIAGAGGFGMGGVRVMDGSKQLYLRHVTRTLPPSLTGYPMEAEIRYYIKVTVQRPGFLKENWRFQAGFKFLPIEPPRDKKSGREAFARRPFTFRPRPALSDKRSNSLFGKKSDGTGPSDDTIRAPSVEMAARLPHPAILTCNKPVPLRLIAKNLVSVGDPVYLVSFQMDLISTTEIRARGAVNRKLNRWVVASDTNLMIPLLAPEGEDLVLADDLWKNKPLPNTVAPSFEACNLMRRYELEIKLGLSWGKPKAGLMGKGSSIQPQQIFLPLHFAVVEVFSGIAPPPELVSAAQNTRPGRATMNMTVPPQLPPRTHTYNNNAPPQPSAPQTSIPPPQPERPPRDPLYPPQLAPGQTAPAYDDAPPPSYDEAMAENLEGPFDGMASRPAYSGVTNENAPSQMREKS